MACSVPPRVKDTIKRSSLSLSVETMKEAVTRSQLFQLSFSGYIAILVHNDVETGGLRESECIEPESSYVKVPIPYSMEARLAQQGYARAAALHVNFSQYIAGLILSDSRLGDGPLVLIPIMRR
jgi:hypothetical protein